MLISLNIGGPPCNSTERNHGFSVYRVSRSKITLWDLIRLPIVRNIVPLSIGLLRNVRQVQSTPVATIWKIISREICNVSFLLYNVFHLGDCLLSLDRWETIAENKLWMVKYFSLEVLLPNIDVYIFFYKDLILCFTKGLITSRNCPRSRWRNNYLRNAIFSRLFKVTDVCVFFFFTYFYFLSAILNAISPIFRNKYSAGWPT